MKTEKIKPIPKYMIELIKKKDLELYPAQDGHVRYYAYLTKNDGELVKMTVAVKNRYKKWYCKQCAMHGIHSDRCYLKDMVFYYIGGYIVGWFSEGLQKEPKWYEDDEWGWNDDDTLTPMLRLSTKNTLLNSKNTSTQLGSFTMELTYFNTCVFIRNIRRRNTC